MTLNDLKNYLTQVDEVDLGNEDNRLMRKAMSELKRKGIIFVSVGNRKYKRIENCTTEEKDSYINKQVAHLRTQYFNNIVPIKNHLNQEQRDALYEITLFD